MPNLVRYAALLRGVSPLNAKMPELKAAYEAAGFEQVRTVLSSGNVLFSSSAMGESALVKATEAAVERRLSRTFKTYIRTVEELTTLLSTKAWTSIDIPKGGKRVVTFLAEPPPKHLKLPVVREGARILSIRGREVLTDYVVTPAGPVFMKLLEETFGTNLTTRTWETVKKLTIP